MPPELKSRSSSLQTLEPIIQNGYFRRKADITSVLHGAITAEIANITSGCYGAILRHSSYVYSTAQTDTKLIV